MTDDEIFQLFRKEHAAVKLTGNGSYWTVYGTELDMMARKAKTLGNRQVGFDILLVQGKDGFPQHIKMVWKFW